MANVAGMCTSFKKELLCGTHAFGTQAANGVRTVTTKDTFNLALFLVSGSRGFSIAVLILAFLILAVYGLG